MDVFSHGLWAAGIYKLLNKKFGKKVNVWAATFWGVFPDVFSFAPLFIWLIFGAIFGGLSFADMPRPEAAEPARHDTLLIFRLTSMLYTMSHSLIVLIIVIALILAAKKMWDSLNKKFSLLPLGGWLIHILIDIPTHSYKFYPTPFLWPISGWKFDGLSWGTPWFMITNYAAITIFYIALYKMRKK